MSRRMSVALCMLLGLVVVPGVAAADPPWRAPDVPGVDHVRGDVCPDRGDVPCHGTTSNTTTKTTAITTTTSVGQTTSTGATTTTTDVAGTSATSTTSTTTNVAGTSATSRTSSAVTSTTGVGVTTGTAALTVTAPADAPPLVSASADRALAETGAAPLWTGVGGLAVLLAGAVLLLVGRRRRA
ncbi:LPXTG cell wall anchor domain-containing protein [Actinosynnema sp. NPDC059335]|uniref:LPXTG cell wall anchor domain-containing protein n=1 Tax=Actinosynnema sp. NPDC059335 TaxID=3346804 RepID=UPI00366A7B1E